MSYRDKYGITTIRSGRFDNLEISFDWDEEPSDTYPVFLFTPDMRKPDKHYHIQLSIPQAQALYEWLGDYLQDIQDK